VATTLTEGQVAALICVTPAIVLRSAVRPDSVGFAERPLSGDGVFEVVARNGRHPNLLALPAVHDPLQKGLPLDETHPDPIRLTMVLPHAPNS
jgi:hypothetical protein